MAGKLKPGEELVDGYVNRPLAKQIVKTVLHTPITPNMLTLAGMVVGTAAGFFFARAGQPYLAIGGLCLFTSMILDCSDGQLARARNTPSRTGRILDGLSDYIVGISVHVGLGIALAKTPGMSGMLIAVLTFLVMLSTTFQSFMLDYYRAKGINDDAVDELAAAQEELARVRDDARNHLVERILLPLYITYTRAQQAFAGIGKNWKEVPAEVRMPSPDLLNKLRHVGPSTHNALIILTVLSGVTLILPYYLLVLVIGNLYLTWAMGSSERYP